MMRKALLLLLAAALCGSLPARNTEETARLLAQFNSHPKADIAVPITPITATGIAGCRTKTSPTT